MFAYLPLKLGYSGKGLGWDCGRFDVHILEGTRKEKGKNIPNKKRKKKKIVVCCIFPPELIHYMVLTDFWTKLF